MKKTILTVLIAVLIATPCVAQEIEPDGPFSLHDTRWECLIMIQILPYPILSSPPLYNCHYGFYNGEVYPNLPGSIVTSFYVDMIVASVFGYVTRIAECLNCDPTLPVIGFGIMQLLGIGTVINYVPRFGMIPLPWFYTEVLIKANDDWAPPDVE
jgi:hypothetical protein